MLTKEQVIEIIKNAKSSYPQILKARHKETYEVINKFYEEGRFSEKVYRWLHSHEIVGRCKECELPTKFIDIENGYRPYCSKKCSNKATASDRAKSLIETNKEKHYDYYEKINCAVCGKEFEALKYREQKCCSGKCSGIYVAQSPNRIEKIKATKLEKYGDETYVNPEKAKETCIEKYGVTNASKSPNVIAKIRESTFNHYGVEHSWQSPIIKDKIKDTIIDKYGVDSISKSPEIKEQKRLTTLKNYGVENPFQSDIISSKIDDINLLKYGFKYPIQNEDVKAQRNIDNREMYYNMVVSRISERVECLFTVDEYINTDPENSYKFKCKKCNSEFIDRINSTDHPRCLICNPLISGFSYKELDFMDYLKIPNDDNHRGVLIYFNDEKKYFVDGLDVENNIVYEFLGDYYHGNPLIFESSNYNEVCQKTFGQLYENTFIRLNNLKSLGYTVQYIWEADWNNFKDGIDKEPKIINH